MAFWHYSSKTDACYLSAQLKELFQVPPTAGLREVFAKLSAGDRFKLVRKFKAIAKGKVEECWVETAWSYESDMRSRITTHMRRSNSDSNVIEIEGSVDHSSALSSYLQHPSVAQIVYEHTTEGILVTDVEGKILSVNEGFSRITGYSHEEAIGRRPNILKSGKQTTGFYQQMWGNILHQGTWSGTLWNRKKDGTLFAAFQNITRIESNAEQLGYVSIFSDITSEYRHRLHLRQLAYNDPLTGLKNRAYLRDKIDNLISTQSDLRFYLLFIDLDNYKPINDNYGHAYGDQILKLVANKLKNTVHDGCEIARFGGDEFIVYLPYYDADKLQSYISQVYIAMLTPIEYQGQKHQLSASVGISAYPQDGENFDDLLVASDLAMYFAKSTKQRECAYIEDMGYSASRQAQLVKDFKQGLSQGQFSLVYQSQFDTRNNDIIGVEALCRWQHPELGSVSPQEFISLADKYGLHQELTDWVITTACYEMHKLLAEYPAIKLSINVSGSLLKSHYLSDMLQDICQILDINPHQIVLEITESEIIADVKASVNTLRKLGDMGVQIAIDDFGKGYSSFYYLKALPINLLKLDKACLDTEINDQETTLNILSAVVSLTNAMNLELIAEGVETLQQLQLLKHVGVNAAQGYYFDRPKPLALWREQLTDKKHRPVTI